LNDYVQIKDLVKPSKEALFEHLCALGDEAARYLGSVLCDAFQHHQEVILLTHVPPFLESCWYQGRIVLSEWTPHFVCGAVGQQLKETMERFPDRNLRVYCGHTHNAGVAQILPNLVVHTGGATYGAPALLDPIVIH